MHMTINPVDSRLLKILIKANSKKFNELDEFAEFVGVSTRTIRNYIKELNSIIMKDNMAELVQVKEAGYRIVVYNQSKFDEFMAQTCLQCSGLNALNTPEERLMYIIEILINSKKVIKIDELAFEINIGRTTLINDLKKIEALLKLYDIKIKGKQNSGITIEGNELNIRLFILDYLKKDFVKNAISNLSLTTNYNEYYEYIRTGLLQLFADSKIHLSDETMMETLNYIMVMLIRVNDNKSITSLEKKYEDTIDNEEYSLSVKIIEMVVKITGYNFSEYEVAFLTLPLLGRKASINYNNIIIKSSVKLLAEQIINEINENLGVSIKYDNQIIKNFVYHLNFMLNRLIFNIKNKNELINDIKKSYPLPYEMAKIAANVIENTYGLKSGEDEIAYMAIYFASYIEQDSYEGEIINKVALVCGTGLGSSQFLNIKLRKLLGKDVTIDNYSDVKLTVELLEKYDIVFTTVEININTQTPIIMVNVIFDDAALKKTLQTKMNLKKYNANHLETNDPILSVIVKKEHFFILEKDNYMDNLEFMIDKLLNLGEVDTEFKNRIVERELKSSTLFGNYVALPHAINNKVNPLLIAFGVLKKHIIWQGEEVKIIILLMIPPEGMVNTDLLIRSYEQILNLAQNKQAIVHMSKLKDYKEFKNMLIKEVIV